MLLDLKIHVFAVDSLLKHENRQITKKTSTKPDFGSDVVPVRDCWSNTKNWFRQLGGHFLFLTKSPKRE